MKRGPQYPRGEPIRPPKKTTAEIEADEITKAAPVGHLWAILKAKGVEPPYGKAYPDTRDMAQPGKPCPEDEHERPCKEGCGEDWCFHAP